MTSPKAKQELARELTSRNNCLNCSARMFHSFTTREALFPGAKDAFAVQQKRILLLETMPGNNAFSIAKLRNMPAVQISLHDRRFIFAIFALHEVRKRKKGKIIFHFALRTLYRAWPSAHKKAKLNRLFCNLAANV